MNNQKMFCALILAFASMSAIGQRTTNGPPLVNYDLVKETNVPLVERRDLVLDNPLGLEIGMVQILDTKGKLMDAAIVRGDEARIDLKGIYMPLGDYILVFNTMLGFSLVQEVTRAQF